MWGCHQLLPLQQPIEVFTIKFHPAYFALLSKIDSPFCLQNCLFFWLPILLKILLANCQGLVRRLWWEPHCQKFAVEIIYIIFMLFPSLVKIRSTVTSVNPRPLIYKQSRYAPGNRTMKLTSSNPNYVPASTPSERRDDELHFLYN